MQKAQLVIAGKEPAPNEFVAYLAEQIAATNDERTTLIANFRQAEQQVEQMRAHAVALGSQINARLNDMRAWWDRAPKHDSPFILKPESEDNNVT